MLSVQYVCKSIEAENNPVFLETTTPSRNEVHHNFKKFKLKDSYGLLQILSATANHEEKTPVSNISKPRVTGKKPREKTPVKPKTKYCANVSTQQSPTQL